MVECEYDEDGNHKYHNNCESNKKLVKEYVACMMEANNENDINNCKTDYFTNFLKLNYLSIILEDDLSDHSMYEQSVVDFNGEVRAIDDSDELMLDNENDTFLNIYKNVWTKNREQKGGKKHKTSKARKTSKKHKY